MTRTFSVYFLAIVPLAIAACRKDTPGSNANGGIAPNRGASTDGTSPLANSGKPTIRAVSVEARRGRSTELLESIRVQLKEKANLRSTWRDRNCLEYSIEADLSPDQVRLLSAIADASMERSDDAANISHGVYWSVAIESGSTTHRYALYRSDTGLLERLS